MENKIKKLLAEHKLACEETWFQLNEFSGKEKEDLSNSIEELQLEMSMRKLFISDLEDLL